MVTHLSLLSLTSYESTCMHTHTAKRQVGFHAKVRVFEYTPEASCEEGSDEISIDSFEEPQTASTTPESGLTSQAVVEDLSVAMATQEAELRSLEEQRRKRRRDKVGSMWTWVNQRKAVADKNSECVRVSEME